MAEKQLRIYLNDHSAGSLAGLELAKRCFANNEGTDLGRYLGELIEEIGEDRADLLRLMDALGMPRDRLKEGGAWFAEKAGRLKLNGQVRGYSDLSRVIELEGLLLGVTGKQALWRSLIRAADSDPRLKVVDLEGLLERAERQADELERFRRAAAEKAFGD
jgi:hypothetical protein